MKSIAVGALLGVVSLVTGLLLLKINGTATPKDRFTAIWPIVFGGIVLAVCAVLALWAWVDTRHDREKRAARARLEREEAERERIRNDLMLRGVLDQARERGEL